MNKRLIFITAVLMICISHPSYSGDLVIGLADQVNHLYIKKLNKQKGQLVSINNYVASMKINELRILAQSGTGKFEYAVIQVNGYTYGKGSSGFCGVGEEENTLWLKFDKNLNIVDAQSYLTTSCKESIGSNTLLRHDADLLEIQLEYSKAGVVDKNRLSYSSYEPEKGFYKINRTK